MKHTDYNSVETVMKYLRMYGFDAKTMMVRKNKKSCDIVARHKRDTYFIEVKDRLGTNRPGSYVIRYGYSGSVNKVFNKAVKQLRSMPQTKTIFRIVWFVISEDDEEEFLLQGIVATFYGIQRIGLKRGDLEIEMDCFFFNPNPTIKYPDLDCLIIQTKSGLIYCLNSNSANYPKFRKTKMYSFHKRMDGLIDPKLLENKGCCLIASQNRDKEEVMQDIMRRYVFKELWVIEREKHISLSRSSVIKLPKGQQSVPLDRRGKALASR
jgi:Holliday junction resolvase-like predicted endonuclease